MKIENIRITDILNMIRNDRTAKALSIAIILILIMALLRPKQSLGMHDKAFWANKISWNDYADVVITGDSRALLGISPEEMQEYLKNRLVVNYAFGVANIYTPEYVESIETILKKDSDKKTIILGISPHALSSDPDFTNQFLELKNLSRKDLFIDTHFAALFSFFEYMSFRDAFIGIFPNMAETDTRKEFFKNGWLAYSKYPPGEKKELSNYVRIYERCHISQEIIDNIMKYITQWTESEIKVYGLIVPTCKEMYELENEISGLNLSEFRESFEKAGGKWIEIDPTGYDSFDGSHLQRKSAIELSQLLAMKINNIEKME